jgi:hypothetical protein
MERNAGEPRDAPRRPLAPRLVLCGFLVLALVGSFYAEENWRGKRAWEICQRELVAQGVELDFQKFAPPAVHDEQNFAMTPFLEPLFNFNSAPLQPGQTWWRDSAGHERAMKFGAALLPQDKQGRTPPAKLESQACDLEAAGRLLRGQTNAGSEASHSFPTRADAAEAVLRELSEYEPVLAEIRAASHRPYSRFNIRYDAEDPASILLPHLLVLQHINKLLQVRASAELALGKNSAAFEDLQLMIYLAESIRDEPFLICIRVRSYMLTGDEQLLWEGLAARRWTAEQLQATQARLTQIDLVAALKRNFQAERAAYGNQLFRFVRTNKNSLRDIVSANDVDGIEYLLAGPAGWFYQEQMVFHRLFRDRILTGFDPGNGQLRPTVVEANQKKLEADLGGSPWRHHNAMSKLLLEHQLNLFPRTALAQTRLELAATACAVERFRLVKSALPENLEALVPDFLETVPLDTCTGQALIFHLSSPDKFELRGAEWPETKPVAADSNNDSKKPTFNPGIQPSDWIWPAYPTS